MRYLPIELSRKYLIDLCPSWELQYLAEQEKRKVQREIRWEKIWSFDDAVAWYISRNLLEKDYKNYMDQLNRQMRTQRIELYQLLVANELERAEKIRRQLKNTKGALSFIENTLAGIRLKTREGIADSVSEEFILGKSFLSPKLRRIKAPLNGLDKAIIAIGESCPSIGELRAAARSHKAQTLWSAKKSSLFPKTPNELQIIFMSYLEMYKNVRKSPHCPSETIMDDDDALDGWLLTQNKEEPKKLPDKVGSREHVFITAENQEEANSIYAQNTGQARALQRARLKVLEKGVIKESEFQKKTMALRQQ